MPTLRRKVPAPAKARKSSKAPAASAKKAKPAAPRKAGKASDAVKKPKAVLAKKPSAPKAPPVPVRPLMKLGREDLAVLRWFGRPPVRLARTERVTVLHVAGKSDPADVAVRDGHSSPMAPLRPDGKVATGLRGTAVPWAAYASSVERPCAACLMKPCACDTETPGVHKDSPYGEESKVDNRVTSWRRWP